MPGFSLTLLLLPNSSDKTPSPLSTADILRCIDAKVDTPGWKWSASYPPTVKVATIQAEVQQDAPSQHHKATAADPEKFDEAIKSACQSLIQAEPEITRLDSIVGDGDC